MLLERFEFKGKKFSSFPSASEQDIDSMWEVVQAVDSCIERDESQRACRRTLSLYEALLY